MKKVIFAVLAIVAIAFTACNGKTNTETTTTSTDSTTVTVDSSKVSVDSVSVDSVKATK